MNIVLGGEFGSRLNMNLREEKNWSYGAFTHLADTFGPRPYRVHAPVQIDKTRESILEIQRELRRIVSSHPVTPAELARVQRSETLRFGSAIASLGGLQSVIEYLIRRQRTPEYWAAYPERIEALTVDEVNTAIAGMLHPERMVWIVTGDLQQIEPQLRDLDLGTCRMISPDGEELYLADPVKQRPTPSR
jgi:predicted Zn-dependent peptidase